MDLSKENLRPYVDYKVEKILKIKGKYGFRVIVVFEDLTDKICQHSGFEKKQDAEKERDQVIALLDGKKYVIYKNVKVEDLMRYWLDHVMKVKPGFTAESYNTYMYCIKNHIIPKIGKIKLLNLNQGHIFKLYNELVNRYSSIPRLVKTILKTSLEFALSKNLITYNPCEDLCLPKAATKNKYHELVIDETKTYNLEQVKLLLKESKKSKIHMQILFALLMGMRKSEIHGLKYTDIDYNAKRLKITRQLGRDINKEPGELALNTRTKQEIPPKTEAGIRWLDIPDYVFFEIVQERKRYEKNKSRRQSGKWIFQDLDYICCSSYGRPRSITFIYKPYKELIEKAGLPYIRFHDLRHTYTTLLMKSEINQKAIAAALGHSSTIISVDVYTDKQAIIEDGVDEMQEFIDEVHPYSTEDVCILRKQFGMEVKRVI